jgi:CubicO group peptidase (beta-lactamase class C family)
MTIRFFVLLLLFAMQLAFPAQIRSQDPPVSRVDSLVERTMEWTRVPGISLAVVRDGQLLLARGYGMANLEHQVPVKPETIFQSGSIGKQFTATLVMMLAEAGKLSLADPVTRYLPDAPDTWRDITIRHLLSHTAGTTDYPDDFDFRRDYTEDELLQRAYQIPLEFEPGERWRYSNMGYVLLGILIHKVSGQFYGDLLRERVFTPLGMSTARVITEEEIVPNRAAGYRRVGDELKNQEWVSPTMNTTADGSLYLTVLDMAKWDAALQGDRLLKRSTLDQMWTPVTLKDGKTHPYGFGWSLAEVGGHRIIEHGGAWQGFTSYISRYPAEKLTVVVFSNLAGFDPGRLAHQVAGLYHPELAPPIAAAIPDTEPKVTTLARQLMLSAAAGTMDTSLFTAEARTAIFPARAAQAITILSQFGPLQSFELIERSEVEGNRVYRYRASYPDNAILVRMVLNGEGKIAALGMRPE